MRDARAAANGERTVTSVPMSLTHSRAWRPARRLPTRWCGTSALLLIPGRIQFSTFHAATQLTKKLAPKKPLEHTTPCVMSAAQVRHGLRRLLRGRLDGERRLLRGRRRQRDVLDREAHVAVAVVVGR